MTWTTALGTALLALVFQPIPGPVRAQTPQGPQDTAVTELQLRKEPEFATGQVALVQGTTAANALRFRLNNLSVLQPVIASVLARETNDELQISLLKPGRESPKLSASTRGEGSATLSTRTQGGLDFLIEGPAGTPFALMVWVSDELTPRLAGVIVRPEEYRGWAARHPTQAAAAALVQSRSAPGAGLGLWMVIAGFLAGGLLVVLTLLVVRRGHA